MSRLHDSVASPSVLTGLLAGLLVAAPATVADVQEIRLDLAQGILALSQEAVVEVADDELGELQFGRHRESSTIGARP